MKRYAVLFVAVVLVLGMASLVRAQGANNNFTLVNATGYQIDQVFVAPSASNSWEEDVLGQDVLEDGASVNITFHAKETATEYDLKVVYSDKTEAVWTGLKLPEINKVTIKYSEKKDQTIAVVE